jgi:CBS domain-containing protein
MASPTLIREVTQFLHTYPPFNQISQTDLEALASEVKLQYFEAGEYIFHQDNLPYSYFFIVKKGNIHIIQELDNKIDLVDKCDEGDVFGVRALLAGDNYIASAKAEEDSLLYEIPIALFEPILEKYPKVAMYFVAGFASGITVLKPENLQNTKVANSLLQSIVNQPLASIAIDTLQIPLQKKVITCTPQTSIQSAAQLMNEHNIGSLLIVDESKKPVGIITDADFRKKVVCQADYYPHQPVKRIMSAPVKTISPEANVAEITLTMARHKITHLCITEDGTIHTPVIGVVSQRDVLVAQGNNPAVLIKQILQTEEVDILANIRNKADELIKTYLQQDVGIPFISYIITQINDVLIEQAVKIAQKQVAERGMARPNLAFCWLSLGSEGRKEQLRRTDQDNALVYENPADEKTAELAQQYFLALSQVTCNILTACGFEECPAKMIAANPQWCLPLQAWERQFGQWIAEPDTQALLHANIFFDFRPVAGDESLAHTLKHFIFRAMEKSNLFLPFLAKNALQNPPPLSFFRQFMVEKSGEHKHEFDLKARAMMPLADAARVLALEFKLENYGSTYERFEEIAYLDENLKDICEAAAMAYEILLKLRTNFGFKNQNSGRFINPDEFNKLERQTVRNIFKTIEKIQQVFSVRYQLSNFR